MCKTDGCERAPAWRVGRLAGLCERCGAEASRVWHRDLARINRRYPCAWRDCGARSTVRLWFGGVIRETHRRPRGVNYCAEHAEQVRRLFIVDREGTPARTDREVRACGTITRHGTPCRRARVPGELTCASHRLTQAAA